MDFIEGLPHSFGKKTIFMVVDRLSKYTYFVAISHPYNVTDFGQIFMDNSYKLHGMPQIIVCDYDSVFTSTFWKGLFLHQGTKYNMSSSYHECSNKGG